MNKEKKLAYLHYLKNFVTKERQKKIQEVLGLRTRHITIAIEDLANAQNVAAIMRTCEAMGLQEMHAIELTIPIDIKTTVARGAVQWMELHRYNHQDYSNPTLHCIDVLKNRGYQVIATSPHAKKQIKDLSYDKKIAFLFGTENTGLSDEAFQNADELISLPQYGFVESYNVAVSAALCLYDSVNRLRSMPQSLWSLDSEDKLDIEIRWMERSVDRVEIIKKNFLSIFD